MTQNPFQVFVHGRCPPSCLPRVVANALTKWMTTRAESFSSLLLGFGDLSFRRALDGQISFVFLIFRIGSIGRRCHTGTFYSEDLRLQAKVLRTAQILRMPYFPHYPSSKSCNHSSFKSTATKADVILSLSSALLFNTDIRRFPPFRKASSNTHLWIHNNK